MPDSPEGKEPWGQAAATAPQGALRCSDGGFRGPIKGGGVRLGWESQSGECHVWGGEMESDS